jgi:hypothetical protein
MLYKLYRDRWFPEKKLDEDEMESVYKGFQEIYKKYGVKVVGAWDNADDTDEGFLITAYRDKTHYEDVVAKMRDDPKYQELSKTFEGTREMLEVVNMKLLPGSPT